MNERRIAADRARCATLGARCRQVIHDALRKGLVHPDEAEGLGEVLAEAESRIEGLRTLKLWLKVIGVRILAK